MGVHAAVVNIQNRFRIVAAKKLAALVLWWKRHDAAVRIQSQARRLAALAVAIGLVEEGQRQALFGAILFMQTRVRGWRARARAVARARHLAELAREARKAWAATCVAAFVRGCFARRARLRRAVELGVNQRVLRLAHRYLKSGDLWSFVEAVDADYRRFERDADEARRREDDDAVTFVERVLDARDRDHQTAWKRFMDATKSQYVKAPPEEGVALVPGPRLRLLLDGIGADGVTAEVEAAAKAAAAPIEAGRKRRALLAGAYDVDDGGAPYSSKRSSSKVSPSKKSPSPKKGVPSTTTTTRQPDPRRAVPTRGMDVSGRGRPDATAVSGGPPPEPPSHNRAKKAHASWAPAYRGDGGLRGHLNRPTDDVSDEIEYSSPAGLAALVDVPGGLDDTSARLLKAAALRAYVPPEFRSGTSPAAAFATYQKLPPSLLKTKHELDAHGRVTRWITGLRLAGYKDIRALLPPRRCRETILALEPWVKRNEEPGAPVVDQDVAIKELEAQLPAAGLADACCRLLIDLHHVAKAADRAANGDPSGVAKGATADRWKLLERGELTNAQAVAAAKAKKVQRLGEPDHSDWDSDDSDFQELCSEPPSGFEERAADAAHLEGRDATPLDRALRRAAAEPTVSPIRFAPPLIPHDAPNPSPRGRAPAADARRDADALELEDALRTRVRADVERAGGLSAPMHVFVARAKFLSDDGQAPLSEFADAVSCASTPEDEASLLRERQRNAAKTGEKMAASLTREGGGGGGAADARDLAALNLRDWGASESLAVAVEALLNSFAPASRAQSVRSARNGAGDATLSRSLRETGPNRVADPRARLVKLPYDPRFQRGPFDPTGRPGRLRGQLSPRKKPPTEEVLEQRRKEDDEGVPLPDPLFGAADEAAVLSANAQAKLAKRRKKPPKSIEPQELVPLHLQPQEFVGAAHRSRKLTQRIHDRATSYFTGYADYTTKPQLGRDESAEAYQERSGIDTVTKPDKAHVARQVDLLQSSSSQLFAAVDAGGSMSSLHTTAPAKDLSRERRTAAAYPGRRRNRRRAPGPILSHCGVRPRFNTLEEK